MYVGATNKPVGMPKPDCKPELPPDNQPTIMVDGFLSTTSTNPVQNKVITNAIKSIKKLTKVTIDDSLDKYNKAILEDISGVIIDGIKDEVNSGLIKDKFDAVNDELKSRLTSVNDDIKKLDDKYGEDISSITSDINKQNASITELSSSINSIDSKYKNDITNLSAQISELREIINSGGGGGGGNDEPPYTPITATLSASPAGGSYKKGETISPVLTWTSSEVPTSVTLTGCSISDFDLANKGGTYNVDPITSNKTYTLKVSDGKTTVTKSVSYKFVDSYYWGLSDTTDASLIDLSTLESAVEDGKNHSVRYTAEGKYLVYVTPYEVLSIKDGNNFENLGDFKETKIGNYYYYITVTPKVCTKFKYTFIYTEED